MCGYTKHETIPKLQSTGASADGTVQNQTQGTATQTADTGSSAVGKGSATAKKKNQKMTVKPVKKTVKASKLKSKKQVVTGALKVSGSKGKLTYTVAKKNASKYLTINKTSGKITIKKGTKKGTYSLKITVKASGNSSYNAALKTVTAKIIVK